MRPIHSRTHARAHPLLPPLPPPNTVASHAFEFNDRLPLLLAHHLYSCRFGTFIFNTDRERAETNVEIRTASLWAYVLGGGGLTASLRAAEYRPRAGDILLPVGRTLHRGVTLWTKWFARYSPWPTLAPCTTLETYPASAYDRDALEAARLPPLDATVDLVATGGAAAERLAVDECAGASVGGGAAGDAIPEPAASSSTTASGAETPTADAASSQREGGGFIEQESSIGVADIESRAGGGDEE